MKIKEVFQNKGVGFYIGLGAGVLGLVNTLIYLIYSVGVNLFAPLVFVMLLLGVVSMYFYVFTNHDFSLIVPIVFFSSAFGLYVNDRVIMFEEMINHIYGMSETGAILGIVILIFILCFISILALIVASFLPRLKK